MSKYTDMVDALKSLTQETGTGSETITLPFAEDEWYTRPDVISYGIVNLEFEAGALNSNSMKTDVAYEGSVDLFSMSRGGAGWIQLITETLTEFCDSCWELNHHAYERDTGMFHWEWRFQIVG